MEVWCHPGTRGAEDLLWPRGALTKDEARCPCRSVQRYLRVAPPSAWRPHPNLGFSESGRVLTWLPQGAEGKSQAESHTPKRGGLGWSGAAVMGALTLLLAPGVW